MVQLVKLEPGDILVIGNYGSTEYDGPDVQADVVEQLKDLLGISGVIVFSGDPDLSSLPAGWTPESKPEPVEGHASSA